MKRLFALAALLLIIGAPLAEAAINVPPGGTRGATTAPAGDILD